jgi:hypothetical protein
VLLPDPISVWEYLKGAAGDGTLVQASLVTMRRLLAGYIIGIAVGLPLGFSTASCRRRSRLQAKGRLSVGKDLETVLRKIEYWHQAPSSHSASWHGMAGAPGTAFNGMAKRQPLFH